MATITKFEELEIWRLARQQANDIYILCSKEPFNRDFQLKNQVNRSSGSVMDNIAEGFDRSGNKEFVNFLIIAKGSNAETRSQLYRAFDRNYIDTDIFTEMKTKNENLGGKIMSFLKYLKLSEFKGQRYK
ncbi:MAG: four helix bundle protein [Ferruginibacter sp.]